MLLGDLLASFEDPAFASEALLAIDDRALMARVTAAAAEEQVTPGEFAVQSLGRFVNGALVRQLSRAESPGQAFLHRVLTDAVAQQDG